MPLNLNSSERYKNDLQKFQQIVDSISNLRRKRFFEELLEDYKKNIDLINNVHSASNPGKIDPLVNRDAVDELIKIRNVFYSVK